jgi:hypothetical protein
MGNIGYHDEDDDSHQIVDDIGDLYIEEEVSEVPRARNGANTPALNAIDEIDANSEISYVQDRNSKPKNTPKATSAPRKPGRPPRVKEAPEPIVIPDGE